MIQSPDISPLLCTEVRMCVDSLHMPDLLRPVHPGQVPVPGNHLEVCVVQVVVSLGTEPGTDHPPGGEQHSGTVVASQTSHLQARKLSQVRHQ